MARSAAYLAACAAFASAATPEQISIHYTPRAGVLSVDFVSTADAAGSVTIAVAGGAPKTVSTTSFNYDTIGHMHQATLDFASLGAAPGSAASYVVSTPSGSSAVFNITPVPQAEGMRYAVWGDFGLVNDECMTDIVAAAKADKFDAVLHVGDFACA